MLRQDAIQVNLTAHCNLKCKGCDHSSPHLGEEFASLEQVAADLQALSRVFHAEEIRLIGGEPLLHPQLIDFLKLNDRVGIADRVTVVTNGLLLHKVTEEFWQNVDRVWVSVYPGVKYKFEFPEIEAIAKKHDVPIWIKASPSFYHMLLNQKNQDPQLVKDIYQRCRAAHLASCHTVHEGYYFKCSASPYMEARLKLLGIEFENRNRDGVRIQDNPNLEADIERYLADREPLASCNYCLGTSGKLFQNEQLNKIRLKAELTEDHRDTRELIDWERFKNPWAVPTEQLPTPPPWGWPKGMQDS